MNSEDFEKSMRSALKGVNKPQEEIHKIVSVMLNLKALNSDSARLTCYNQWRDKVNPELLK